MLHAAFRLAWLPGGRRETAPPAHHGPVTPTCRVAFIPFICAGDPDLETTAAALRKLDEIGADVIELGVPYSVRQAGWRAWAGQQLQVAMHAVVACTCMSHAASVFFHNPSACGVAAGSTVLMPHWDSAAGNVRACGPATGTIPCGL